MSSIVVWPTIMFVAKFRKLLKQMGNCEHMLLLCYSIEATMSCPVKFTVINTFYQTIIISPKLKFCMIFTLKCPEIQRVSLNLWLSDWPCSC